MADCWRELASRPGVELKIWIEEQRKSDTAFDVKNMMRGLDFGWDYSDQITDIELRIAESEIKKFCPDVLFICGWSKELPPFIAKSDAFRDVPKILCCDMPWEWKPRKFAARFVLWRHLRRFRKIMVPGESAAKYARWLGFGNEDIIHGEYGVNTKRFQRDPLQPQARKGFLFVGRLVPDKGIRTLAAAYRLYRQKSNAEDELWPLEVYGTGPEAGELQGIAGVSIHGFAQPETLPRIYAESGAFVLASNWEPWGVVLVEAAASGTPIICTDKCGAWHEMVKGNGIVVKAGNRWALAEAMLNISRVERIDGELGRDLAEPYSCKAWADRVIAESEKCIP